MVYSTSMQGPGPQSSGGGRGPCTGSLPELGRPPAAEGRGHLEPARPDQISSLALAPRQQVQAFCIQPGLQLVQQLLGAGEARRGVGAGGSLHARAPGSLHARALWDDLSLGCGLTLTDAAGQPTPPSSARRRASPGLGGMGLKHAPCSLSPNASSSETIA